MKIIHCADIHADSKMDSHFSKEKASSRRNEIARTFEQMVKFAQENEVRAVIIAGDLFDTKITQQKTIKKQIAYIIRSYPKIDFLYLRGNHDEGVDFEVDCGCELKNLKRFSKDCWEKYEYDGVSIIGREFSDKIPAAVYNELVLDPKSVNIVTLHGQVADYAAKDGAPVISLPKLQNANIDYLALGHIHDFKIEKLDSRGVWCYSGCLEGRGFDECGEKGFVLLDIENGNVKSQFVPFGSRTIHEVNVTLNGAMSYNEIMDAIKKGLHGIYAKDIVQVVIQGEINEETEVEPDAYQAAFQNYYFYIRFKDKTEPKIEYEKYANDVSLKGEFIRLVAEQDISEEEKTRIIMTGLKALAGRL